MCLPETLKLFPVGVIRMYEVFVGVYTSMDHKESSCILGDYILYYSICYLSSTENSSCVCMCYKGTVSKRQRVVGGLRCNLDE